LRDNLKYNNLGGQGPVTTDPPELRYDKVFTQPRSKSDPQDVAVDLVIKVAEGSKYHAFNTARNGLWPEVPEGDDTQMGQINIDSGSESTFDFMFVESGTDIPYALPDVLFSVYDIDQNHIKGRDGRTDLVNHEYVVFPHDHASEVTDWALTKDPPTGVKESGSNADGTLRFTSTQFGVLADNPTNPLDLSPFQKSHSVTVFYADSSKFQVTFGHEYVGGLPKIHKNGRKMGGRNVIFAGPGIYCPPEDHLTHHGHATSTELVSKMPDEMSNGSSDNNTAAILVVFVVVAAVVGVAATVVISWSKQKHPQDVTIRIDTAPAYSYDSCPSDAPNKFIDL